MENRRELLKLAGLTAMTGLPLFSEGKMLPDRVTNPEQAALTQEPFGDQRVFFDGPTEQLKSMTAGSLALKPGMEPHPPHRHPEEEFLLVTEGTGEFLSGGKTTKVGPGSMLYCEGNHLHGVRNTGSTPLLFYYFKWKA